MELSHCGLLSQIGGAPQWVLGSPCGRRRGVRAAASGPSSSEPWRCGQSLLDSRSWGGKAGLVAAKAREEELRMYSGWVVQPVETAPLQDLIMNV